MYHYQYMKALWLLHYCDSQEWQRSYLLTKARRLRSAAREGAARNALGITPRTRAAVATLSFLRSRVEKMEPLPVVEVLEGGEEAQVLECVITGMNDETSRELAEMMG